MANGIYVASSGSKARLDHLETVSNNLANLMTAGFKRQDAIYREVHNDVSMIGSPKQAQGVRTPTRFLPEDRINVAIEDRFTYWDQGNLDETGNVLDLAIELQTFPADYAQVTCPCLPKKCQGNKPLDHRVLAILSAVYRVEMGAWFRILYKWFIPLLHPDHRKL